MAYKRFNTGKPTHATLFVVIKAWGIVRVVHNLHPIHLNKLWVVEGPVHTVDGISVGSAGLG